MTDFLKMAESVKQQAEAFLDAEGIAHDAPMPEIDEGRTIGDLVAAPMPEDRITAALEILVTVDQVNRCRMAWLTDIVQEKPGTQNVERYAALAYRLSRLQLAMLADKIHGRRLKHQSKQPRTKGADREGSAAWLVSKLTAKGRTIDEVLCQIAESPGTTKVDDLPMELHKPRGGFAEGGHFSNDYIVKFHFGNKWRQKKVKTLREAEIGLRKVTAVNA